MAIHLVQLVDHLGAGDSKGVPTVVHLQWGGGHGRWVWVGQVQLPGWRRAGAGWGATGGASQCPGGEAGSRRQTNKNLILKPQSPTPAPHPQVVRHQHVPALMPPQRRQQMRPHPVVHGVQIPAGRQAGGEGGGHGAGSNVHQVTLQPGSVGLHPPTPTTSHPPNPLRQPRPAHLTLKQGKGWEVCQREGNRSTQVVSPMKAWGVRGVGVGGGDDIQMGAASLQRGRLCDSRPTVQHNVPAPAPTNYCWGPA